MKLLQGISFIVIFQESKLLELKSMLLFMFLLHCDGLVHNNYKTCQKGLPLNIEKYIFLVLILKLLIYNYGKQNA